MRVGVDLLSIERFSRVARHPRYRTLVFTESELAEADALSGPRTVERLAGRFCAKEATAKVLGRGLGQGLGWRDIEIVGDRWGAPKVTLRGRARRIADEADIDRVEMSLSHEGDFVVCVAASVPFPDGEVRR
ncbi:holo-ACP synthase [Streptomyces sp. HUAS MG91]|uniref:Holo-[acyl-carrier-protein] synthase n=1 Tax=Streptomyces tabacisoli TaxID=3156398 RepID=A0AAU8IRI0_9ACTN